MKLISLLALTGGLIAGAALVFLLPEERLFVSSSATEAHTGGARYACPMMDFISNKPGDCPVCGMEMGLVTAGELTREQTRRLGLETSKIIEGPAKAIIRAYGAVRYDERSASAVVARVPGRVVRRHAGTLHEGTLVEKDDPLVDLYSPEVFAAQAELAAAAKLADTAARDALLGRFERWNLRPVAEAILGGAAPSDTVTIRSPYAGLVMGQSKDEAMAALPLLGEEIMADRALVRLVAPDAFMVVVYVPETRARWLREGQKVSIASDDFGEMPEVEASISWVSPELDTDIRAREVHLHLVDPKGVLLPGSLISARIEATLAQDLTAADPERPETWGKFPLVPKSAVLSTGTRHVAWKVDGREKDGRVRFVPVPLALGPRLEDANGNDHFVVRAGISLGDEVATRGAFLIDSQAQLAGTPSLLFPTGANAAPSAHQH
jgi:Cu(I)/Ag(I) efflux system membrane fusion protein